MTLPSTDPLNDIYAQAPSIVSRQIAGEAVLVPMRHNTAELDAIYALNETAAVVWAALDGKKTLQQVLQILLSNFEVDGAQAEQDLLELIAHLNNLGAVIKV